MKTITLNGNDWLIKNTIPGKRGFHKIYRSFLKRDKAVNKKAVAARLRASRSFSGWLPAEVPGNVQNDMFKAGRLPEPNYSTSSRLYSWTERREWWYGKSFVIPPHLKGKIIRLCFSGVDYSAQYWLNGKYLGKSEGMFHPVIFEITETLRYGQDNSLIVKINPAPEMLDKDGRWKSGKAMVSYGWDFCTRLVPLGLWDDVEFFVTGKEYILDYFIRSEILSRENRARIYIELEISSKSPKKSKVKIEFFRPRTAAKALKIEKPVVLKRGENKYYFSGEIKRPELWWPAGYGKPNLYRVRISVGNSDVINTRFGIREIKMLGNPLIPGKKIYKYRSGAQTWKCKASDVPPWIFQINGVKIYVKGANWVPADLFFGRVSGKWYKKLINLAVEANVNLFRVWGGGLIEKSSFYEICDESGIMIWQEFPGHNIPSSERNFLSKTRQETTQIVKKLRNYPCIVLWSGGNELPWMDTHICPTGEFKIMRIRRSVCKEYDDIRPYIKTSPINGESHGPWAYYRLNWRTALHNHYKLYNEEKSQFQSEFGCPGLSDYDTLKKIIPRDALWPINDNDESWIHHKALLATSEFWTKDDWLNKRIIKYFFGSISSLKEYVRASQFLQGEGLRYAIESCRRRKYYCSGSILWQFNEPWLNAACTNIVQRNLKPKLAYYFVKKAYEPISINAKYGDIKFRSGTHFRAEIWCCNDTRRKLRSAKVFCRITDEKEKLLYSGSKSMDISPDSSVRVMDINYRIPSNFSGLLVLFLELKGITKNTYFFGVGKRHALSALLDRNVVAQFAGAKRKEVR